MKTSRLAATGLIAVLLVGAGDGLAKGPAKTKDKANNPPAPAATPAAPRLNLPADLNAASLRVQAIDTVYELDLSPAQLKALRTAGSGTASTQKRTPAPANAKLADALSDFAQALLNGSDDDDIAKLHNQLQELASDENSHLDDDVDVTVASRSKAAEYVKQQLNAGQIAAYLASHADQITDPAESMLSTLLALRDIDYSADVDSQIQDAAGDLGWLIAGADAKAAAAMTAKAVEWFKANHDLTADQQAFKHDALEASAKKVVGEVPPMDILSHWMNNAIAELLSNPQLPQAVDAVLAAKAHS